MIQPPDMLSFPFPLARGEDWLTIIIFIILFLGSGLVQLIKRVKGQTQEEEEEPPPQRTHPPTPQRPQPPPRQWTAESDEVRRFLEALGKPKSAPPPPVLRPVAQPAQPPPVRRQRPVVAPAPAEKREDAYAIAGREEPRPPERVDLEAEMRALKAEMSHTKEAPLRVAPTTTYAKPTGRAAVFAQMLSDKTNVRRAVVLAEVLGPPKALSTFEPQIPANQ